MADDTLAHRAKHATVTETVHLPPAAAPTNHGKTLAAWVTCWTVVIGGTLAGLAVAFALVWGFWVGIGICFGGIVAGLVLKSAGFGQGGEQTLARQKANGGH